MAKHIAFEYLYRDAGNYKLFETVIFSNRKQLTILYIRKVIDKHLSFGQYFIPQNWQIKSLRFDEYEPSLDHPWHEISQVVGSNENYNDSRDISDFLKVVEASSQNKTIKEELMDLDDDFDIYGDQFDDDY